MIVVASAATVLQEKTARTPRTLRVAGGSARYARSHAVPVGTYNHGCHRVLVFLLRYTAVCTKEKAQHGTAVNTAAAPQNNENETEISSRIK